MRHLPLLVVLLTACADDPANGSAGTHGDHTEAPPTGPEPPQPTAGNAAPAMVIQSPGAGDMFTAADTLPVVAIVSDGDGLSDIAEVLLSSSIDGELDVLLIDDDGVVRDSLEGLSVGEHTLTLTVTDLTGEQGSDEVIVHIQ